MTRNKKIAEKMEWELYDGIFYGTTGIWNGVAIIGEHQDTISVPVAHLLIEQMSSDGWIIKMIHYTMPPHWIIQGYGKKNKFIGIEFADFPDAVVKLFCRVYSINTEKPVDSEWTGQDECDLDVGAK